MATLKELLSKMIDKINGIPTKLSELEIDMEIGSEQIQSDWSQNDETASDYVKNRPFWAGEEEKTIKCTPDSMNILVGFREFAVGDTVTINVDGVEHSLVAFDYSGIACIGDAIETLFANEGIYGWSVGTSPLGTEFVTLEEHTVSYNGEKIVPCNKKYIPNYDAMVFYLNTLIGDFSFVESSDEYIIYSVSPDVDFYSLPTLSMCNYGNLGYAEKCSITEFYVSFSYTRLLSGIIKSLVFVYSNNVERGIKEYKADCGIE